MSRIRDAIMEATGYSVRGEQAEAAARAVGELIRAEIGADHPDHHGLALVEDLADALNGGCVCSDCEEDRASILGLVDDVAMVQALADEALGESD